MRLLVCGCIHGRFDVVATLQRETRPDLTLLLGDLYALEKAEQLGEASISGRFEVPMEYERFTSRGPALAIFGNHELLYHCRHEGMLLKPNLYLAGTNMVLAVIYGRRLLIGCISGISKTKHQNPFYVGEEHICDLAQFAVPNVIMSHQWPRAAVDCNRSQVNKEIFHSYESNACDYYLQSIRPNQQLIWVAAHMHKYLEGFIYRKNACTFRFLALSKVWLDGGYEVLELQGSKEMDGLAAGIYVWDSRYMSWMLAMPLQLEGYQ